MGRDIVFYVLPRELKHDSSKMFCFNLERVPEESWEIHEMMWEKLGVTSFEEQNKDIIYSYMYDKNKRDLWCPKCEMYVNGLTSVNPHVIACRSIHHSYSNPIWNSDWNIYTLFVGDCRTKFVKSFKNFRTYFEITKQDINKIKSELQELGKPEFDDDITAYEETCMILDLFNEYVDDQYMMIMEIDI